MASAPLRAGYPEDLTQVNIYDNIAYRQTSTAAPTVPSNYFFDIGGDYVSSGDFNSASATFSGNASPLNLPVNNAV